MVNKIEVEGYSSLLEAVKPFEESDKKVFVMFSGAIDKATGKSWCPDCVTYGPVVDKVMSEVEDENVVYIYCSVGGRDYWKNQSNEFRTDPKMKLAGVPTLMVWGNPAIKLVEDNIATDLVKEMIEES